LDVGGAIVRRLGSNLYIFIPFKGKHYKYTVVIDPGHGGKDTGAIYYGVEEKKINLSIAKKLYALLRRDGRFNVYMTRYDDRYVPLGERQIIAAKAGADLFISIHANAAPKNPRAKGVEFYILSDRGIYQKFLELSKDPKKALNFFSWSVVKNRSLRSKVIKSTLQITRDEGEELAEFLCYEWGKITSKYIPCNGIYERAFAVLKVPGVPTVLVETGFMTNREELKKLTNSFVQWKIAESLYLGILDYFNLKPPDWIKEKLKN
jgi:N-acetylmuramoyl-L-alanine amidase